MAGVDVAEANGALGEPSLREAKRAGDIEGQLGAGPGQRRPVEIVGDVEEVQGFSRRQPAGQDRGRLPAKDAEFHHVAPDAALCLERLQSVEGSYREFRQHALDAVGDLAGIGKYLIGLRHPSLSADGRGCK